MTVHCVLAPADYRAFRRHVRFRYQRVHWLFAAMLALILCASWFGAPPQHTTAEKVQGLTGATVGYIVITAFLLLVLRVIGSRPGSTLGEHVFDISPEAVIETNPQGRIETRAAGIRSVDETKGYFFIITQVGHGHVIPKRCLDSAEHLRALQQVVRARRPNQAMQRTAR